jgi:serine/threonine-protein kinase
MPGVEFEDWNLVSHHLDCLLELAVQERAAYLDALAPDHPEVAGHLRRLLTASGSDDFSAFLAGSAIETAASPQSGIMAGKAVGPYVIDSEIGAGGMGTVWRAQRADGRFQGYVAIKFIHPAWMGRQGEQRFRLEGQLLGRLQHHSIARLLDAGVLDGIQPYLVLEYVDGEPIDAYCKSMALDRQARIALFIDVLEAVAHAHSRLVVHRDLKPSNVLVTRDGAVKLLDFGIAKLLDEGAQPMTQSNSRALTPQYAAPEQLSGDEVSTATDVYALGLLLYLLLSGTHPLAAGSPTGTQPSGIDLIHAILTRDPPRVSTLDPNRAALRRMMAADLDNIVAKALKKQPEERYRTASAFADDLRRFLAHEPVQARADTVTYRVAKFAIRHRGAVLGSAVIAAGLISTSAFALVQMSEARLQRDVARSELQRAEAANDFSSLTLEQVGEGGKAMTREQLLDQDVQLLDARFGGDREFVADMLTQLAARYSDVELNDQAMALTRRAVETARQTGNRTLLAMTMCEAAWQEILAPEHPHVDGWLAEAQEILDRSGAAPLRTTVSCLLAQEAREQNRGHYDAAVALLNQAHARHLAEGIQSGLYYSTVLKELSLIYFGQGRYGEAFQTESEAGESFDRGGRGGTHSRALVHQNLGTLLVYRGEPRAAMAEFEASRQTINGTQSDDELPLSSRCAWAWSLRLIGQSQRARSIISGAAEKLLA